MGTGSQTSSIYTAKEKAANNTYLRARLAGVAKPRRLTTHFFWAQENKEAVKALKEEEVEEEDDKPKKKRKRGKKGKKDAEAETEERIESEGESAVKKKSNGVLTSYQALCKSEFEKLDASEQNEWKELAELDLAEKSAMYTAITKGQAVTTTPRFRQQWVDLSLFVTFADS